MYKPEKWSTRTLQERINSMLYAPTTLSKKPAETIIKELQRLKEGEPISPDLVFRDTYFLDFLGLKDTYSEKDWKLLFLPNCSGLLLNWEMILPSWHDKNALSLITAITK